MGKNLDKFLLLMWKNFLLQWRHPKQTLVEILAPVLFTSLMVVLRSLVHPEVHAAAFYTPFENLMPNTSTLKSTIAWSPKSDLMENIMDETIGAINLQRPELFEFRHYAFNDSKALDEFLSIELNTASVLAGIQFDDSLYKETRKLPPNLNVTFRFPSEVRGKNNYSSKFSQSSTTWKTNLLFPSYQVIGPREESLNEGGIPSYYGEGFLTLQQELSLSLISQFKKQVKKISFDRKSVPIYMQRFPYPKYTRDLLLTALKSVVGLIFMVSFVYTCISTVKIINQEKEKQLKEAMKIMGLPNWLHWTAWYLKTFMFLFITVIIMVILLKAQWYPGTNYTIFTHSNPMVIFVFLLLFVSATITYCFAISVFFTKANTASTLAGLAWFISYFPYAFFYNSYDTMSLTQKLSICLFSNTAMAYGFQLTIMFEGAEEGLQWHNIWTTLTPDDNLKLGHLMIMLLIDSIIYLLIALYVEAVFPGDYGVPQPWYFLFTSSYWCGKPHYEGMNVTLDKAIENEFYEKEPLQLEAGIKIKNLRKTFSKRKVAVKDLTLNMYKDQITVLLGHNGAGKTTTMSMLTGMFPPTSGSATVGGYDIRTDIAGARQSLGLCPQHNILFDELTVKEHLYFYSRLKGLDRSKVDREIAKYVQLLELVPKADKLSSTLSGGMKRKLAVGVALCADSSVVMLDEPTAGMDPSARRALWDLLQSQKKGRTILLSTHFMDEADLLGDRIAIMAGGNLQCCGSSFFLKKKYGAGYHLIMDKLPRCNVNEVTALLQQYIPGIEVEGNIGSELTYVLNEEHSAIFEMMLGELELCSSRLGITSYGISLTTLEEVFMKVGADHGEEEDNNTTEDLNGIELLPNCTQASINQHTNFEATNEIVSGFEILQGLNGNETEGNYSSETKLDMELQLLTGWSLWYNQIAAMFMKRGLSVLRSWILLLFQILIPVTFLILTVIIASAYVPAGKLPDLKIGLQSYHYPITVLTRQSNTKYSERYIDMLKVSHGHTINWENKNMALQLIKETEQNATAIQYRYIVGASFKDDKSIVAWFNNQPYHSAPLSLQLVMNSILHQEVNSTNYTITIRNHPIPYTLNTELGKLNAGNTMGFQIAFNIGFGMAFASAFYILFYIKERVSKAKHLQFVSGVEVASFWIPSFLCDICTFALTSLSVIVVLLIFQEDGFKTVGELGRLFSLLLFFGFAMLPMNYLGSYLFDVPTTGYTRMTLINIFLGAAAFMVIQVLYTPDLQLKHVATKLHWVFLIVPHYALSSGIQTMNMLYASHKICDKGITSCINATNTFPGITFPPKMCETILCYIEKRCCASSRSYYNIDDTGIGKNVVFLSGVGIILLGVLLIVEYRVFEKIIKKIRSCSYTLTAIPNNTEEDSDVHAEKERIRSLTSEDINKCNLVMRDVTKFYGNFLAVNNICLGINKYECFGLLGVNGAGKTTTFKMMTGDIKLSSGDAWVNGLSLKHNMKEINQLIGYCPQFDALLDDLTCRETLIIFGLLRGITKQESNFMADKLAYQFDFYKHIDKQVKELSGGNKRKLSTAIAMIGEPLVIYLDEPTTGMDPATKRYLWNALCKVRDSGKCIILTSHSMEECEALCTRLAIMVNGTFKCLGSTQHLKNKFSEGYTLIIKVRKSEDHELEAHDLEPIENFVKYNFRSAVLREKHQELMTFYIADKSLPWSRMFGIMETGKTALNIEDYSLGQCSLEQVFLTFTKQQQDS